MTSFLDSRRGYDHFEKVEKEAEDRIASFVNRFWLPPEKGTKIVFLDDNPPIIEEHQLRIDGNWRNWISCLSIVGQPCPLCESGDKPYTAGFYTVIDTTEWTDRKGIVHKNEVKLYCVKFQTLKKLKRASAKQSERGKNGLVGAMFEVYRGDSKAPSTGDEFEYLETLSDVDIRALNPKAAILDYEAILKPKSPDEIRRILGKLSSTASDFNSEEDIQY